MIYRPWLEWQKNGNRINCNDYDVRACPFCEKLHLTIQVCFNEKVARVECRNCSGRGPWVRNINSEALIENAVKNWNGELQQND